VSRRPRSAGCDLWWFVPDELPVAGEVPALRAANSRLREVIEAKDEMLAARDAQIKVLAVNISRNRRK
jgi:hypothetical protein